MMEDLMIMLIVLNLFIVINMILLDFWFLTAICKLNDEDKEWRE